MKLSAAEQTELCFLCEVLAAIPDQRKEVLTYALDQEPSLALRSAILALRDGRPHAEADETMEWATRLRQNPHRRRR